LKVGKSGGWSVLKKAGSLQKALAAAYPDFPWESNKFIEASGRNPMGHWKDDANLYQAIENAATKLGISQVGIIF